MKRRWQFLIYGIIVAIALIIGFRRADKAATPSSSQSVVHWKTKDPLKGPSNHPLTLGKSLTATTENLVLPKEQLSGAEWYLPITKTSTVSFILHDSQARWVDRGVTYTLSNVPTDPVDELSYSTDGQSIGWVTEEDTVTVINDQSPHETTFKNSSAIAFTAHNVAVTWNTAAHQIEENGKTIPLKVHGVPAHSHPLLDHGTLIATDQYGTLMTQQISSGKERTLAAVNPKRWPVLLTARSTGPGVALLLERPGPIPKYLLILSQSSGAAWYRFVAYNVPEIGVIKGHLIIENLISNDAMAIITGDTIHPLNVSAGIFSAGPFGIIWQGAKGFVRLTKISE